MAKIVEFIGTSGIGKTTTLNALSKIKEQSDEWITFNESLFEKIILKKGIKPRVKNLIYKNYNLFSKDKSSFLNAKNTFIKENKDLIDLLWDTIANDNKHPKKEDVRLNSLNFMFNLITKHQLILENKTYKYIVTDEGLIHNINFFVNRNNKYHTLIKEQVLRKLSEHVAVVIFYTEIESAAQRLWERPSKSFLDEHLSFEEIKLRITESMQEKKIIESFYKNEQLPYLTVDAYKPAEINAGLIKDFINQIK